MRILFIFVDGIGLGDNDAENNPFAAADLPTLHSLTAGQRWLRATGRAESARSTLIPTDACLGVGGRPQSATGQAAILTGINVPKVLGYHYGPKPDVLVAAIVRQNNFIRGLAAHGLPISFLNAYPPAFFESLRNGKRLLSSNQLAMHTAGVPLHGKEALYEGRALSADFTGEGWRTLLGYPDAPLLSPFEAGQRMAHLAMEYRLTFFDHWVTDYVGHRGTMDEAIRRLKVLDEVLAGILEEWDDVAGLVVLTSDHGNLEDLSTRGHTTNPVPTLVIGRQRQAFAEGLSDLTDLAPRVRRALLAS